jgi:hypothetical protein
MKSEPQWLSTNVAPEIIQDMPVTVKDKLGFTIKAKIIVEKKEKGLIVLAVQYDSSPFPDMPKPSKFYLTQEELDEYLGNAGSCVLNAPPKS